MANYTSQIQQSRGERIYASITNHKKVHVEADLFK